MSVKTTSTRTRGRAGPATASQETRSDPQFRGRRHRHVRDAVQARSGCHGAGHLPPSAAVRRRVLLGRQRWHALVSKHPRQGAAGHRRDRPQAAHRQRAGGSGAHRVPARLGSHAAAAGCAGECARRQQRGGAGRARRGDHLMAVVNEHGATATTLNEYLEQIRQAHLAIDPDWNIEPESPDGLRIAIEAELLANLDEAVLHAYQSVDPLTAIGQQLNRIAQFAGLTRQAATPSTATVTFTGANGTLIPAGTQIRNSQTDTIWTTDGDVTISDGTATVGVTCTKPGPEPAAVGTLSIIATPVGGVQS